MNGVVKLVKEVQAFAGKQLYVEMRPDFADLEEWNIAQLQLAQALAVLEPMNGNTPEEEGELVLAILMGYCVTVRDGRSLAGVLERALRVIPQLTNPVLKCKLAAHCYLEVPDEELLELVRSLIEELKRSGRGGEVLQIEKMILD